MFYPPCRDNERRERQQRCFEEDRRLERQERFGVPPAALPEPKLVCVDCHQPINADNLLVGSLWVYSDGPVCSVCHKGRKMAIKLRGGK